MVATLGRISRDKRIHISESQTDDPSPSTVDALRKRFSFSRRVTRRLRVISAACVGLLLLTGIAVWLWTVAAYEKDAAERNLAATFYALANAEEEERGDSTKALLLACKAVEAAPRNDPMLMVYMQRTESLALACPLCLKVANRVDTAALSPSLDTIATVKRLRKRREMWSKLTVAASSGDVGASHLSRAWKPFLSGTNDSAP
jgi:hypothetical protein